MPYTLPKLPFDMKALEPYMSEKTLSFHYGKHHQTYVDNLNKLVQEDIPLETLIKDTFGNKEKIGVFNNAAQVWNHAFFWSCLKKDVKPSKETENLLAKHFGSIDKFKEEFKTAATGQFGSGWAWLCKDASGKLSIVKTGNAENPMTSGLTPIITLDVWEHAYYLDYQNKRVDFIDAYLNHLLNWDLIK